MKTKIVEHIAGDALHEIRKAIGELTEMRRKYSFLYNSTEVGAGLDAAVLMEQMKAAEKLIKLLAK